MYKKIFKNMQVLSVTTLVLALILILSVCYTFFNSRLVDEMKNEIDLLASTLNMLEDDTAYLEHVNGTLGRNRLTLVAPDGTVLYDSDVENLSNHEDRPEIQEALLNGTGESTRQSITQGVFVHYYAKALDNGSVIRVASDVSNFYGLFVSVLILCLLIILLIYFISVVLAQKLTDNITRPLNELDLEHGNYDGAYDELSPLVRRIESQKKEIGRQVETLKAQKLQLQMIGDQMNEGLAVLDQEGNVLSVNQSALGIFGAEEQDVLNHNFLYLSRDPALNDGVKRAEQGEKHMLEFRHAGRAYQVFFSPVSRDGAVTGVILLLFDVSERAQAELIRREFTANVSHELKTPLTTILGYAQMITGGMVKEEDIRPFAAKIEEEASRLIALIEDIIKLSELDEREQTERLGEVELYSAVQAAAERLAPYAAQKGIALHVDGSACVIWGNVSQVEELAYNLCENAIKYNKEHGSVRVHVEDGVLTVEDTGIGIPEEYQERVFERFFRVDKSHSKKVHGTGLGLSIVKHIALAHHAEIKLDSVPGEGTTVTVRFQKR